MNSRTRKLTSLILVCLTAICFIAGFLLIKKTNTSALEYENCGYIYLSDISPKTRSVEFYDNISVNQGYPNGNPSSWTATKVILLNNGTQREFSNSICGQSTTTVVYDISEMKATSFSAYVGVNYLSGGGSCNFDFYIDNVKKYSSKNLYRASDMESVYFSIPSNASELKVVIGGAGDGGDYDHGIVAEPKLFCSYVDLEDITPLSYSVGYGEFQYNTSPDGKLSLFNKIGQSGSYYYTKAEFDKGIFAHASSEIQYDISSIYVKKFTSLFGIHASQTGGDGATFSVIVDGNVLATQKYNPKDQMGYFSVSIPFGAKKLTLKAVGDDNINCDHAIWVSPRLYGVINREEQETDYSSFIYVTDIAPQSKSVDFYDNISINKGYPSGDTSSYSETPISLFKNGVITTYSHGITCQSTTDLTYSIANLGVTRFVSDIGVNYASGAGTCRFFVYIDGEQCYASNVLTHSTNAETINIPVYKGAETLRLVVDGAGDGGDYDHGVFADPKLYCEYVDLSNLTPSSSQISYGEIVYDSSYDGGIELLNIIGQGSSAYELYATFDKCITAHATNVINYDISKMQPKKFTSYYGIHPSQTGGDGVVFSVYVDDVVLYSATSLPRTQMGFVSVNIPSGAKKLTLKVDGRSNIDYDHAMWACPRIYGTEESEMSEIELSFEDVILSVGERTGVSIKLLDEYKREYTPKQQVDYTFVSSNSSIARCDENNKIYALKAGNAFITVSAEIDGKIFSATKEIVVGDEGQSIIVSSPDLNTKIKIALNSEGKIIYEAAHKGDNVIEISSIGFNTSIADFSSGLTFVSATPTKEINDTYEMRSGKANYYTDHCFEKTVTYSKGGNLFTVYARVYNDGVAYRYVITPKKNTEYTLFSRAGSYGEKTVFGVPENSITWSTPMPDTTGKCSTHEQFANEWVIHKMGMVVVPFFYKTPNGTYVYVMEAGMNGQYAGVVLKSTDKTHLQFIVSNQQQADIKVTGKFTSSWRTFTTGTLKEVYETQMIENVSDPCKLDDISWIDAGVASWSWMEGVNVYWSQGGWTNPNISEREIVQGYQHDKNAIKKYINLSADFGWKYFILDDGWQPYISIAEANALGYETKQWSNFSIYYHGYYDWMQEVCDYARSKGVGLITWIHTGIMDTEEKMDELFSELRAFGIKGIKVDFFDSEEQWIIELYQKIYQKAAEYHLLVIVHGANKPSGERRTYPNVVNREAIYGEEMNKTITSNMTVQAYLRSICGPADFTPYISPVDSSDILMSGQLALSIIYEAGTTCFASTETEYRAISNQLKFYYTDYPSSWDESIYLSGEIGDNISIARKGRDVNRWYVGGLTLNRRTDIVDFSFLDDGVNYRAYIYEGGDKKSVTYRIVNVTKSSKVSISMADHGGYAILVAPTSYSNGYSVTETSLDKAKYMLDKEIARYSQVDTSVYTDASVQTLNASYNNAITVKSNSGATETQVLSAKENLKNSINSLVKSVFVVTVENGQSTETINVSYGEKIILSTASFSDKLFIGWEADGKLYKENTEVIINEDTVFTARALSFKTNNGARARIAETLSNSGLRFELSFNTAEYREIEDYVVNYGGLILPTDYVKGQDITLDNFVEGKTIIKVVADELKSQEAGEKTYYHVSLININSANYKRAFSVRGYILIRYYDGEERYIYSDYSELNNSRSIAYITEYFKTNDTEAYNNLYQYQKDIVDAFIGE